MSLLCPFDTRRSITYYRISRVVSSDHITIILRFLNTLEMVDGLDQLSDAAAMENWIGEAFPASRGRTSVSIQDMAWAIELREALRDLASANSGDSTPSPASVEVVNRAARTADLSLGFGPDGSAKLTSPSPGLEGAAAGILIAVHRAMSDGSWLRLKICRNPECRWAFYDRSRNHSRVWCEMKECGNKMKARRFRQRSREEGVR
jgi:predicted RNA-binding Zn ribbon-like protein